MLITGNLANVRQPFDVVSAARNQTYLPNLKQCLIKSTNLNKRIR